MHGILCMKVLGTTPVLLGESWGKPGLAQMGKRQRTHPWAEHGGHRGHRHGAGWPV